MYLPESHRTFFSAVVSRARYVAAPLVALLLCFVVTPVVAMAQPAGRTGATSSTADGIYTTLQANSGADIYAMLCQSCHSAESHTGAPFRNKWVGRSLADLYTYISTEMPKAEPGSLSEQEYALVLAYMLRMNGMPAGRRALSSDSTALSAIRIEMPAARAGGSSRR